jgi:hypothetical protein
VKEEGAATAVVETLACCGNTTAVADAAVIMGWATDDVDNENADDDDDDVDDDERAFTRTEVTGKSSSESPAKPSDSPTAVAIQSLAVVTDRPPKSPPMPLPRRVKAGALVALAAMTAMGKLQIEVG